MFWKSEIHNWNACTTETAGIGVKDDVQELCNTVAALQCNISAIQAENQSHHKWPALQGFQLQQVQSQNSDSRSASSDGVGQLTKAFLAMERCVDAKLDSVGTTATVTDMSCTTRSAANTKRLLKHAKAQAPDSCKHLNDRKG